MRMLTTSMLLLVFAAVLPAAKDLRVYFIDVEGGESTLFVAPSGESLLVDTGYTGHQNRDALRIAAAAKSAGVKKIDYLLITHYHADHAGGVYQLSQKMPILHFIDHGPSVDTSPDAKVLFNEYSSIRDKASHTQAKPGDAIPIKDLDVRVLSSAGNVIASALPGARQPNAECSSFQRRADDHSENAQSAGILVTYGNFRLIYLGDLTWNKEYDLVCPNNKIGTVDAYLISGHGNANASSPQFVHAIHPRVAVMGNGARKGGSAQTWQTVHDSPGLLDLWQLHYAIAAEKDHNSPDTFIANVYEQCQGNWLRLTAQKDGSFTLYNKRNKFEKTYTAR
ncbi:MAG TPA: MBL fold metallo-hydrolase [Bryobacteraceae bacterium]|nr:MBL fold metallo-hydrolase [Bryobacteraceae bacterium]